MTDSNYHLQVNISFLKANSVCDKHLLLNNKLIKFERHRKREESFNA